MRQSMDALATVVGPQFCLAVEAHLSVGCDNEEAIFDALGNLVRSFLIRSSSIDAATIATLFGTISRLDFNNLFDALQLISAALNDRGAECLFLPVDTDWSLAVTEAAYIQLIHAH